MPTPELSDRGLRAQALDAQFLLRFAEERRFGQGKEHDFIAGDGADVVVHADHRDAGDFLARIVRTQIS
jgi:hypothetical protein